MDIKKFLLIAGVGVVSALSIVVIGKTVQSVTHDVLDY